LYRQLHDDLLLQEQRVGVSCWRHANQICTDAHHLLIL